MLPSNVIDAMESMLASDGVSTSTTPQYVSQGVSANMDSELKVCASTGLLGGVALKTHMLVKDSSTR